MSDKLKAGIAFTLKFAAVADLAAVAFFSASPQRAAIFAALAAYAVGHWFNKLADL